MSHKHLGDLRLAELIGGARQLPTSYPGEIVLLELRVTPPRENLQVLGRSPDFWGGAQRPPCMYVEQAYTKPQRPRVTPRISPHIIPLRERSKPL